MPHVYDAIVLGLGGMGSAAIYHLASRGQRVLGLEKFGAAHNQGSSHGESRIIRQAYHEGPGYVPLVLRAYQLWERLERDAGASILTKTGGLMIGPEGSSVVEGAIRSATRQGLSFELLQAEEIKRRFPAFRPRAGDTAVYEADAGFLRPEAAIHAHLKLAAQHDADLRFHEAVEEWTTLDSGDRVVVKTGRATYEASRLVIAPGAWAPELLASLRMPFEILRHVMCWFQPLSDAFSFKPERFPIYIWDVDGHYCFYGFPATGDAGGVKAAMHSGGQVCSADTLERQIFDGDISEVRECLQRFLPSLNGPLVRGEACMYTMTPDRHFVVGIHPDHPQVSIACGFSGHGFKFTCVMGEILADLAMNGSTQHRIDFLSPARIIARD